MSNPEVTEYYNKLAKRYDEDRFENTYGQYIHQQEEKIVQAYLSKKDVLQNLDMACGTGRFLCFAKYGVDISENMISEAQAKFPTKTLKVAKAEDLPFYDAEITNITAFHLFMHLHEDALKTILDEAARVTKSGGYFIFDVPSAKRRKLVNYKAATWHGGYQINANNLINLSQPNWTLVAQHGVAFLPIHRIPKALRKYALFLDNFLANGWLKEYSSHIIYVLKRA